jgi:hypothetical protein
MDMGVFCSCSLIVPPFFQITDVVKQHRNETQPIEIERDHGRILCQSSTSHESHPTKKNLKGVVDVVVARVIGLE